MNDLIDKLKAIYNELEQKKSDVSDLQVELNTRQLAIEETERRQATVQNELNAKQRSLDNMQIDHDTVHKCIREVSDARRSVLEAKKLMDNAEAMKVDNERLRAELESAREIYRAKDAAIERAKVELEARKNNLRAEILEELRKKLG